ncbi:WSSV268 [White spot syndrome virus]|uniref:WSSV268 n=1 Tax=White spot syndrome virus TaxID=342409 RepID=A0A2I6SBX7_9VIRU|nr:WSSV268 [White spot syndrome virus]
MAHKLLFLEEEDAKEIGTLSHPEPSFALLRVKHSGRWASAKCNRCLPQISSSADGH